MHNKELVSIIMAAYNSEKTISVAIDSVICQTYANWELIIVNDCSNDSTLRIIKEYSLKDNRIRIIDNIMNMGASQSRKVAADAAKGEWIAVLDSDDAWDVDKLRRQRYVAKKKNAKLVFTGSSFMDEDGNPIGWQLHVPQMIKYRELLKQNLISNSSVLIRKDLYSRYYAIGDDMHEDFSIWLQVLKSGIIAYGIDKPLLKYRISRKSKSGNKLKAARMNWNTYRYIGLNPLESFYYMIWYTIRGILKYRHIY